VIDVGTDLSRGLADQGDLRRLRAIEFVANESSTAGDPCDRGVA